MARQRSTGSHRSACRPCIRGRTQLITRVSACPCDAARDQRARKLETVLKRQVRLRSLVRLQLRPGSASMPLSFQAKASAKSVVCALIIDRRARPCALAASAVSLRRQSHVERRRRRLWSSRERRAVEADEVARHLAVAPGPWCSARRTPSDFQYGAKVNVGPSLTYVNLPNALH